MAASGRSGLVMGVDDDPGSLRLVKDIVENAGYSFRAALNGQDCLGMLSRMTPRIILLDVVMSDMDGFETCRQIRKNPTSLRVPVIFVTVLNDLEDMQQGMDAGGNDFIIKPVNPDKLLKRVDH